MAEPKDIRRALMIAADPLKVPLTYASMDPDARAAWKTDQMAREGHGSFAPPGTSEREDNFNRWYSSSKIRDTEGNPLRLYHATPKSFDTFIPGGPNPVKEMPSGPATWLSPYPDKQPAGHHVGGYEDKFKSGANVMPVHADIRNPLVIDNKAMRDWARQSYAKGSGEFPLLISPESRQMLLEDGYDGILWAGSDATSKDEAFYDDHGIGEHPSKDEEIIALHPSGRAQIKSAIGNRGQYDPEDMHVNYARGGSVAKRALMIARDQRALLRRIANIYPGPGGGMDPSPGGGGYGGPGGGKYIGPSRYADGGTVWDRFHRAVSYAKGGRADIDDKLLGMLKRPGSGYAPAKNKPATVKIPGYGEVEARPIPSLEQAAAKYMKGQGRHHDNEFSPFNEEFARKVAEAFERMEHNPRDPKVKRAYDALIDETLAQYHAARDTGLDFKFIKPGEKDPYAASPSLGYADIVNKGKLHVFPTDAGFGSSAKDVSGNPLLKRVGRIGDLPNATANDAFRIVHDLYGHYGPGNPFFRAPGEERAFRQHAQMYGPEARKAAATETRGQNSWVNYGPFGERNRKATGADTVFADQKTGLMPDWAADPDAPTKLARGGVPPFKLHSGAAKLIEAKGQKKATPQQYAAMPGIKPDELKHSNFGALGNKALPREEVIKHLEDNAVPLQESVLRHYEGEYVPHDDVREDDGNTKYHEYQLPGGENYREVLLQLPTRENEATARELDRGYRIGPDGAVVPLDASKLNTAYRSGHWDAPNVLAHVRMSDRRGPNGEKILHVEEVQSDWGQQGRDQGFAEPSQRKYEVYNRRSGNRSQPFATQEEAQKYFETLPDSLKGQLEVRDFDTPNKPGVPRGPYVDNTQKWTDLALKRVLHEAAHGGYDKIAVTPGDEQNKRYDLSNQVKNISYFPDIGYLHATTHDDKGIEHNDVKPADLAKHIGKEAADRILKQAPQRYEGRGKLGGEFYHALEGDDLKVGGSGMRGYYDNILPKRLQALAQQHDPQAKVQLHAHPTGMQIHPDEFDNLAHQWAQEAGGRPPTDEPAPVHDVAPLHSLDVTPQMRDSIKQNGFNQFKRGGEVGDPLRDASDAQVRAALGKTVSPFGGDPEHVKEALRIASTFKVPTTTTSPGGYYGVAQDRSPEEVAVKLSGLPGVKPKPVRKMSWEDLHKKGGSFINLGGDRSTFGRLTRINGQQLAWPVDLHAGPNYMRELNPGLVWANAPAHATSLNKRVLQAAEKGPVYGVYAPMGPRAVDSAHHMFDAVMAQVPGRDIDTKDAAEFDAQIKQGLHMPPKKRALAAKALEKWPGVLNAKEASEFARTLSGEQRSGIVQHMDKKQWRDKGFPQIGVTRVAITDPDVFKASGNMLGHRVVQLDPDKMVEETKFRHSTYSAPTAGEYVGDVPLVQRHYAAPDVVEQRLLKPTATGDIIHPYSVSPVGRSSARKIFEEQKNVQPLNQRQLDSVMLGLQRQKEYGLKNGGRAGYALSGRVEQLGRDLHQSFADLNRQVAAPQQAQAAPTYQATPSSYQAMTQQATQPSLSPAYQRMLAQALAPSGKTYDELFPKTATPAPAAATPAAAAYAAEEPQYYTISNAASGEGGYKRGGRTTLVERALAVTRRK